MSKTIEQQASESIEEVFHAAAPGFPVGTIPDDLARALDEDNLLAPERQTIRTLDELFALDPETVLAHIGYGQTFTARILQLHPDQALPAVVIATGDHVRAARKALEEA